MYIPFIGLIFNHFNIFNMINSIETKYLKLHLWRSGCDFFCPHIYNLTYTI